MISEQDTPTLPVPHYLVPSLLHRIHFCPVNQLLLLSFAWTQILYVHQRKKEIATSKKFNHFIH